MQEVLTRERCEVLVLFKFGVSEGRLFIIVYRNILLKPVMGNSLQMFNKRENTLTANMTVQINFADTYFI